VIAPRIPNRKAAFSRAAFLLAILTWPARAGAATWTYDDWRPTLTSSGGEFTLSLRARLQLDGGLFAQDADVTTVTPSRDVQFKDLRSGLITRRAYLGFEGRALRDFWYEYRMDFGGSKLAIGNPILNLARIAYNIGDFADPGISHLRINAGIIKPIFTYADSTPSSALTFLERANAVNVAASAYGGGAARFGAELSFQEQGIFAAGDNFMVSGAFTGQSPANNNTVFPSGTASDGRHILGRIAYRLWSDDVSSLQVGGSASRTLAAHALLLQDEPEIRVDGNRLVSTGAIAAKGGSLWSLESAANFRSLYFTGEYYRFGIARDTNCAGCTLAGDPEFSGWYVQASWIVTGETKIYQAYATNNDVASFGNPRIAPLGQGNWGAFELAARYSDLDLDWQAGAAGTACIGSASGCVRGGEEKILTLGVNWYLSNNVRIMLDYMFMDVNRLNGAGQQIGQTIRAFGTRLQFTN
jgi:phosphate-selective porin OprO/OprP